MTLQRQSSSRGLLANKGAAMPLGLRKAALDEAETETETPESGAVPAPPAQLTLVPDLEDGTATLPVNDPPPPASLLPFALHRSRPERSETWELVSPHLLERISKANGGDRGEETAAGPEPQDISAASGKPDKVKPPRLGSPGAESDSDPLEALDRAKVSSEASPTPLAAAPAAERNWMAWGAAAVFLIGVVAWWSFVAETPAPRVASGSAGQERMEPAAIQEETSAVAPTSGTESEPEISSETSSAAADTESAAPSVDLVRIEPNGDAVIAGRAAPNAELILLDNGTPIGTVKTDAAGEWVFVPDRPLPQGAHEFGLVLKAVQGKVKITAETKKLPAAEDLNTAPAGLAPSETAPAAGDGAKAPKNDSSLLAPLPVRKPAATQSENAITAPVPVRKPGDAAGPSSPVSSAGAPSSDFVVQLASVKTHDGARREWRKLQTRFPEALSGMDLKLHETKLTRQGTVIRVRTGPFPGFSEAVKFCARIRTGRQDCLVVRTSGGD